MKQDISSDKNGPRCIWAGTTLDLTLSYRGDRNPREAYPIHSSFRPPKESRLLK